MSERGIIHGGPVTLPTRRCTAFDATGTKRCGTIGHCTRVRTITVDWQWCPLWLHGLAGPLAFAVDDGVQVLHDRWVCLTCRTRMRLPDRDVDFTTGLTSVFDHIEDDDLAEQVAFALPGLQV
jgi:hypothetical protein